MTDLSDYRYWYKKALVEIIPGGYSHLAIEYLKNCLKLNPYHIDSWILYAGHHNILSHNDKIVEIINQLLKYKPKTNQTPTLFEFVLNKVNTYTDDDTPLKRNQNQRFPDTEYSLRYCGEWLIAAIYFWKNGDINNALNAFQKSFSYPMIRNRAIVWYIHLILNLNQKLHDKAIEFGEKAVETDSIFKYAWLKLGKAYSYKKEYKKAINSIEEALKLDEMFKPAIKLREEIQPRIINDLKNKEVHYYQEKSISKEERDFLIELEHFCGEPIPAVNEIRWNDYRDTFGFVAKNGHIIGLGLEMNSIIQIPESIKNLTHLEILTIIRCFYPTKIPENIIYLKNLKRLRCPLVIRSTIPHSHKETTLVNKISCLDSLEELDITEGGFSHLPEYVKYLPKLKKVYIPDTLRMVHLPQSIHDNFILKKTERPRRSVLLKKVEIIEDGITQEKYKPKIILNEFLNKILNETEALKQLISLIETGELPLTRIESIDIIRKLGFNTEPLFKLLENLLVSDENWLIRVASCKALLKNFSGKVYDQIKWYLLNEDSIYARKELKNAINEIKNELTIKIKNQFKDIFVLIDIEQLIGRKIPKIESISTIPEKHVRYGTRSIFGYVEKYNRIIELGLKFTDSHLLNKLPESIGNLTYLEIFRLDGCSKLKKFPNNIGNLKYLEILNCTSCRSLENLPESIGNLESLEQLILSQCYSLKTLPTTIVNLNKLRVLNLKDCQSLISLSEDLGGLVSLRILNLKNCRSLKSIPHNICNLQNLEEINLMKCRNIKTLPEEIGYLKSLKILKLKSCTRLSKIPKSIGNLKNQEIIDLSYCYNLKNLPEEIGNLKGLKKIILQGCRELESVPESIGDLENLEELNLYACRKLKSLPSNIGKLKNLKKLELSYCSELSYLPDSIINLKGLEEVNLDGCLSLISIQKSISKLDNLKVYKTYESRPYVYEINTDNMYNIGIDPRYINNPWSPYQTRKHQKELLSITKYPDILFNEKIEEIKQKGVCIEDTRILVMFFEFIKGGLEKAEIHKKLEEDFDDMGIMHHFKIDNEGRVIELHLHAAEAIYLTIFPEFLCSLENLEVIRFPNNCIEDIPEYIVKLKSLRVFDVSNFDKPRARIPDSIKSFIKSLEHYNKFYR